MPWSLSEGKGDAGHALSNVNGNRGGSCWLISPLHDAGTPPPGGLACATRSRRGLAELTAPAQRAKTPTT